MTLSKVRETYGDYVGGLYYNHGATLSPRIAEAVAKSHGVTLADLTAEGLTVAKAGTVKTLALVEALGY